MFLSPKLERPLHGHVTVSLQAADYCHRLNLMHLDSEGCVVGDVHQYSMTSIPTCLSISLSVYSAGGNQLLQDPRKGGCCVTSADASIICPRTLLVCTTSLSAPTISPALPATPWTKNSWGDLSASRLRFSANVLKFPPVRLPQRTLQVGPCVTGSLGREGGV